MSTTFAGVRSLRHRTASPLVHRIICGAPSGNKSMTVRAFSTSPARHDNPEDRDHHIKNAAPDVRGLDLIKRPRINKGMAFSLRERQLLGIHGLLPPAFMNQDQQATRVITNLRQQPNDLARYVQLNALQDRNEKLFYRVLCDHVEELMPIVYTPTVGLACQKFGFIYRNPKGVYITINDNCPEKIYDILSNWPESDVRAIVVTDGERILGLGDLGAYGMGIPVGKLSLYVALAGIQPQWCLPVMIDVGTDNQELLDDPFYIGLRKKRVRGAEYDKLIDNFMKAAVKRYGQDTLIQFEDFGNKNAFRLLDKYKDKYCTFNDDIQGTASVAVAGLLAATRITKRPMADEKILFFGAGEASLGIALLTVMQMQKDGLSFEEACNRIYLIDSKGLIVKSRTDLTDGHKIHFAKDLPPTKSLIENVKSIKPSILIGAATIGGAFNEEVIRTMGELNKRPIIFALSNPTSKAECTAEAAYSITNGRAIFASGSPFDPVTVNGQKFYPGQGNNSYIFPGVALGTILCGVRHVGDEHFLLASRTVADLVTEKHLSEGRLYPPLTDVREISVKIAVAIAEMCYKDGTASHYPEPSNKEKFIREQIYDTTYGQFLPDTYDWPEEDMKSGFTHK
uniref:Malic enzyme n=1 Tax=Plectus sambesii TaxID=2011161 RepID=A0A914VSW9_9BILA